jgi:hypothetical protein
MISADRQRGQALVEVVVLGAALVPLLLAIPLIAKYQDIRHAAIGASRTAAFECSVRPAACADAALHAGVADDLRRRHFARHDHDLLTRDAMADDPPAIERNRFWVDRRGVGLLAKPSDVTVVFSEAEADAIQGAWSRAGGEAELEPGAIGASGLAGPGAFGLQTAAGLVSAQVTAGVSLHRRLAQWLEKPEGMRLSLRGRTAVMVDSWNASSGKGSEPTSFLTRVDQGRRLPHLGNLAAVQQGEGAAPAGTFDSLSDAGPEEALDLLYSPIRMLITGPLLAPVEPRGALFRYHEIDVDLVPEDRLVAP